MLGRSNKTKPVIYPMIQLVVVILYTKYELSILYSCGDIFDEKCGEKEKRTYKGRINRRLLVLNPTMQQLIVNLHTKILAFYLEQLLTNLKSIDCMERKKI